LAGVIVLDASVLIALISAHDAHHDLAASLLDRLAAEDFVVHPVTLAEVLVGGARLGRANRLHGELRSMGLRPSTPESDEPLILAELRNTTGLKLPDCCVLATALAFSAPVVTLDAQLARVARDQGLVVIDDDSDGSAAPA
jgi:predicted nucleic acid-binding protein